jgi:hypothetical protein
MTVLWFSNKGLPVALSVVVVMEVTVAALPLSRTSMSFTSFTRVAPVGIGPRILRYCSPWSSFAWRCVVFAGVVRVWNRWKGPGDSTHRVEVGYEIVRLAAGESERRDDTKGREDLSWPGHVSDNQGSGQIQQITHLEPVGPFKGPLELGGVGADSQVVQDDIPVVITELGGVSLIDLGLFDLLGVLVIDVWRRVGGLRRVLKVVEDLRGRT